MMAEFSESCSVLRTPNYCYVEQPHRLDTSLSSGLLWSIVLGCCQDERLIRDLALATISRQILSVFLLVASFVILGRMVVYARISKAVIRLLLGFLGF
jgi:hypothetical protein